MKKTKKEDNNRQLTFVILIIIVILFFIYLFFRFKVLFLILFFLIMEMIFNVVKNNPIMNYLPIDITILGAILLPFYIGINAGMVFLAFSLISKVIMQNFKTGHISKFFVILVICVITPYFRPIGLFYGGSILAVLRYVILYFFEFVLTGRIGVERIFIRAMNIMISGLIFSIIGG